MYIEMEKSGWGWGGLGGAEGAQAIERPLG